MNTDKITYIRKGQAWSTEAREFEPGRWSVNTGTGYHDLKCARDAFEAVGISASLKTLGANQFKNANGKFQIILTKKD